MAALPSRSDIMYPVLVPNIKGLSAAIECKAKEVAIFGSASEGFSKANINCSVAESLERFRPVVQQATANGLRVRGYISCVIACPYDGPTPPSAVTNIAHAMLDMGCYEISLGDTIGVGTPGTVQAMLEDVMQHVPKEKLAGHFHDTYGMAIANCIKAWEMGVSVFDSSVGGLGGCPYAQGAKGNVATEDVVYAFQGYRSRDCHRSDAYGR
jgi:hydroxymethylglutaryl-CoA lyase